MAVGTGPFDDPDNYLRLARSLAAGQGLALKGRPTAYRPPLYPILLAPIVTLSADRAITAIAIFHLVLGGATAGTTAVAARRWGLSRWRVIAATWIVAIDPVLAWQSRFIMTETLTAFLIASALAALTMPLCADGCWEQPSLAWPVSRGPACCQALSWSSLQASWFVLALAVIAWHAAGRWLSP